MRRMPMRTRGWPIRNRTTPADTIGRHLPTVIPAKAGIHFRPATATWVPAFARTTTTTFHSLWDPDVLPQSHPLPLRRKPPALDQETAVVARRASPALARPDRARDPRFRLAVRPRQRRTYAPDWCIHHRN